MAVYCIDSSVGFSTVQMSSSDPTVSLAHHESVVASLRAELEAMKIAKEKAEAGKENAVWAKDDALGRLETAEAVAGRLRHKLGKALMWESVHSVQLAQAQERIMLIHQAISPSLEAATRDAMDAIEQSGAAMLSRFDRAAALAEAWQESDSDSDSE